MLPSGRGEGNDSSRTEAGGELPASRAGAAGKAAQREATAGSAACSETPARRGPPPEERRNATRSHRPAAPPEAGPPRSTAARPRHLQRPRRGRDWSRTPRSRAESPDAAGWLFWVSFTDISVTLGWLSPRRRRRERPVFGVGGNGRFWGRFWGAGVSRLPSRRWRRGRTRGGGSR